MATGGATSIEGAAGGGITPWAVLAGYGERGEWAGDVFGEKRIYGENDGVSAFWNGVALRTQRAIIEESKAVTLDALGEDLGEQVQRDFVAFIGYVSQTCADELDLPTEEDLGELDPQQQ